MLVSSVRPDLFDLARELLLFLFRHLHKRHVRNVDHAVVLSVIVAAARQPFFVWIVWSTREAGTPTYLGLAEAMVDDIQEAVRPHRIAHNGRELCKPFRSLRL